MRGSGEVDESGQQVLQGLVVRTAVRLPVGAPRHLCVVVVQLGVVNVLHINIHLSLQVARAFILELVQIPRTLFGY